MESNENNLGLDKERMMKSSLDVGTYGMVLVTTAVLVLASGNGY